MEDNGSKDNDGEEDKEMEENYSVWAFVKVQHGFRYIKEFTFERQKLQQDQYFECDSCKSNQ